MAAAWGNGQRSHEHHQLSELALRVRWEDMLHVERLREWVGNEALSVVEHDSESPSGLEIDDNMHAGALARHLDSRHRYMKRYVYFESSLV